MCFRQLSGEKRALEDSLASKEESLCETNLELQALKAQLTDKDGQMAGESEIQWLEFNLKLLAHIQLLKAYYSFRFNQPKCNWK